MVLNVSNLSAGYGATRVLNGVSLEVSAGEVVAVCGPNGAGKSTLLRSLVGQLTPQAGRISFNSQDLKGKSPAWIVGAGISLCPEGRQVFERMTAEANLRVGAYRRRDRQQVELDIERYFDEWPVIARRRKSAAGLMSGGEQQILAIGRALMSSPSLLLLDEPSLGLAPVLIDQVYDGLSRTVADRELSVLLVEQNVIKALELADRVAVLAHGTIAIEARASETTADEIGSHYFTHRAEG